MSTLLNMTGSDRTLKRLCRGQAGSRLIADGAGRRIDVSVVVGHGGGRKLSAVPSVAPGPDTVSVSRAGLTTYAAYRVTVTNTRRQYHQQGRLFKASARCCERLPCGTCDCRCTDAYCADRRVDQSELLADRHSTFTCSLGQMPAGDSRTFLLIFQAPVAARRHEHAEQPRSNSIRCFVLLERHLWATNNANCRDPIRPTQR